MNHQDIADRFEALIADRAARQAVEDARISKERESLRELCEGLGHVFKRQHCEGAWTSGQRWCAVCYAKEGEALPDLHANPATTARVYDRSKESKRGAL